MSSPLCWKLQLRKWWCLYFALFKGFFSVFFFNKEFQTSRFAVAFVFQMFAPVTSCAATLLEPIPFKWIILTRCSHSLSSSHSIFWTLFWCSKFWSAGAYFSAPLLNGLSFLISRGTTRTSGSLPTSFPLFPPMDLLQWCFLWMFADLGQTLTLYIELISLNPVFVSGLDSLIYIVDIEKGDKIPFSSHQYSIKIYHFNWMIQMHSDSFVEMFISRKTKYLVQKRLTL